ncbi:MAG TPA: pilus assembly protein TadE [Firmicutes bacterium]|nr:pilus assembly protein TadE [Bacillota bacterium]
MLCHIIRIMRSHGGQSAVEFALILPILMLVLLGITDFGRILNQQQLVTEAARAAVRTVVVSGNWKDADTVVKNIDSSYTVTVSPKTWTTSNATITVTVSTKVTAISPMTGAFFKSRYISNSVKVTGESSMPAERLSI